MASQAFSVDGFEFLLHRDDPGQGLAATRDLDHFPRAASSRSSLSFAFASATLTVRIVRLLTIQLVI